MAGRARRRSLGRQPDRGGLKRGNNRIQPGRLQADDTRAVAGGGGGVASVGADARAVARPGDGGDARPGKHRHGSTGPRSGGRRRRPGDRRGAARRPVRVRARDRHLPRDPRLRRRYGPGGRPRKRRDEGDGRRGARRLRRNVRRRHLPCRADLLPRPATRAARDPSGAEARRPHLGDRLSTAERNPFFSIPVGIIRRVAGLPAPAPGLPGPFSLGSPGVLETAYADAGFEDVDVRALDAPVRFSTAAECVRFERESFGALHAMLAGVTPAERERAWQEIETELRRFEDSDGFEGPCQLLIGSARRGA
jgi:hypothetical protein